MIRRATIQDIDSIVLLAVEFFEPFLAKFGVPVIPSDIRNVALQALSAGQVLVVEHDGQVQGVTAWAIIPHPANNKLKIFYETIWCVKSKYKTDTLLLLRALEREATAVKADLILMANLSDIHEEQLKRIFGKRGFSFVESHYSKQL
jgi:hypothetical protein